MTVKIVRLTTGEELIGNVEGTSIANPALIVVGTNPLSNQMKVQLMPWAMFISGNVVQLKAEHIMYCEDADLEIYERYNQTFGSGITVATRIQM